MAALPFHLSPLRRIIGLRERAGPPDRTPSRTNTILVQGTPGRQSMTLGPLEYTVIGFEGNRLNG